MAVLAAVMIGCLAPSETRLTMAVSRGDLERVRVLVGPEQMDPDQRTKYGWTPLTLAVSHGHSEIARVLVDAGASVDRRRNSWTRNFDGTPPLTIAAASGHADIVAILLDAGAEVDARDYQVRATPLMWAAGRGDAAILQLLLDAGARIERRDRAGWDALYYAASSHRRVDRSTEAAARLLIDRGADVEAATETGATPLLAAAAQGNLDVLRLLLAAGARLDTRDRFGGNPLLAAATGGHVEVVRELLPLFLGDDAGLEEALAKARQNNHLEVIQLLQSRKPVPTGDVRAPLRNGVIPHVGHLEPTLL